MPKKAWIGFAAVLGVILIVTLRLANGLTGLTQGGVPIRIGAIDPLTGPFAAYGEPIRDGILPAADKSTAKRGIEGGKVETTIPNRPHSTTDLSTSQPSPEQPISPPPSSKFSWVWNAISFVRDHISVLLSIVSVAMASYAIIDSKRLTGVLQSQIDQVRNLAALLAEQVPQDLRILVPVDQSGSETGTWGKSVLLGLQTYFRRHGNIIAVGGKTYRFQIDPRDDKGKPEKAEEIATEIGRESRLFPVAVVGPISTGCARKALPIYEKLYAMPEKKTMHLLPVPTDTDLLYTDGGGSKKIISPCVFRMPPPNSHQAKMLLQVICRDQGRKEKKVWHAFMLTHGEQTNKYIGDLKQQLCVQAENLFGPSHKMPIQTIDGEEIQENHFSQLSDWPDYVIVVGPWRSDKGAPCVRDFIHVWRAYEKQNRKQRSSILLSDFPVPDAAQEWQKPTNLPEKIYATFQTSPGALKRAQELEPTSGIINLALFAYGYDAAHLIDHAIMMTNSVKPEDLTDFLTKMESFHGLAQSYKFCRSTHENLNSLFHLYEFTSHKRETEMHHYRLCPAVPECGKKALS